VCGFERVQRTQKNRKARSVFNKIAKKVNEKPADGFSASVNQGNTGRKKFCA
jgi:hypothetical protein